MSYRYWDNWVSYPKKPRLQAEGGIKAKSRHGAIGESWWSRRFIEVLESFNMGARLSRGRSYARSGQVMDLEVKAGVVSARVQGSRRRPYSVRLAVEPLSAAQWTRVEEAMASQALFLAKLLAGEMPRDIGEAFSACDLSLFPASSRDLDTACSCPDWANPCKHLAATYYILAERFDEDPFLIFAWRGRTQEQLIERLRALRGAALPEEDAGAAAGASSPYVAVPLGDCLDGFFEAAADLSGLHLELRPPEVPDAVLRQAGAAPVELGGVNLAELLAGAYPLLTEATRARALAVAAPS